MKYTKEDILRIADEENVSFIRLQFTDILGSLKNVAITRSQLEKALDNKCMFDGSSIEGFVRIEESDMYLHPDYDTFVIFPWRTSENHKVARLICDVYCSDGTPFEGDPRYVLRRAIKKAADMGYSCNVGPECEFFLFHIDENGKPTTQTHDQGGYFDLGPVDRGENCRRDICLALEEMGFAPDAVIPVSGQTYSRKVDAFILNALAGIGQSCMKFATDLRLLANFKEMEEPFEKNQIGSSAMPYKRNPMRCERICALSRYLMVDVLNPSFTTGTQWFERTLDDSANKRVAMAEGFLAADAILNIMLNVTDGIVVYPKVVRSRLMAELPFMASENIMMQAVEKGGNRQELHERLRQHAIAAGKQVKEEGLPNDMVDRIAADPAFGLTREEIVAGLVPENFVGRAPQQVEEFIANVLQPIFDANPDAVEQHASLSV